MQAKRITIITGAFGSGKTEVAVNYAQELKRSGQNVGLIDLDIVNPYFRSRELTDFLKQQGIEVVSTQPGLEMADLPALSPRIFAFLQNEELRVVFDVGGDPVGARTLGRFEPYFRTNGYDLWLVVNPYRPGYSAPEQITKLARKIEAASQLRLTGVVDNANLGRQTDQQTRAEGAKVVAAAARMLNLPVVLKTYTAKELRGAEEREQAGNNLFYLQLFMLPPWEEVESGVQKQN